MFAWIRFFLDDLKAAKYSKEQFLHALQTCNEHVGEVSEMKEQLSTDRISRSSTVGEPINNIIRSE